MHKQDLRKRDIIAVQRKAAESIVCRDIVSNIWFYRCSKQQEFTANVNEKKIRV